MNQTIPIDNDDWRVHEELEERPGYVALELRSGENSFRFEMAFGVASEIGRALSDSARRLP